MAKKLGEILSPARPITIVSGPELMDKFVGSSEANLRAVFDNPPDIHQHFKDASADNGESIAKVALHVIVMDEFDAMARSRGGRGGKGDQGDAGVARDSVVNQLLAKMDGVDELVVPTLVIGLTNKRSLIEPALLRPGRFEVQIEVPPPRTVAQRISILKVHTLKMYNAGRMLVSDAPAGTAAARRLEVSCSLEMVLLLGAFDMDSICLTQNHMRSVYSQKKNGSSGVPSYISLLEKLGNECEGMSGAMLAGVCRAAASRALERAVYDFAGHVLEGADVSQTEAIAAEGGSIVDCLITVDDFENAIQDVFVSSKTGDGASDASINEGGEAVEDDSSFKS